MKGLDEDMTNCGLGSGGAGTKGISMHGDGAPADDAQALGAGGDFNGGAGLVNGGRRKKGKTDREHFRQVNSLLLSASAEKGLRERSEQTGAVAAGSVGVDSATVSEAL